MSIGRNMLRLRKAKGWTQKDMAEKLTLTPSNYSRYENDKLPMITTMLLEVAGLFGVSLDELCDYKANTDNRSNKFTLAMSRLEDMGIKSDVKRDNTKEFVVSGDIVTLDVFGAKYPVNISDISKLVELTDKQYDKMLKDINKGMYGAALASVLNSADYTDKVPMVYWKDKNKPFLQRYKKLLKYKGKLTPDVVIDIFGDFLLLKTSAKRINYWRIIVMKLRDDDMLTDEDFKKDGRWKNPFVK